MTFAEAAILGVIQGITEFLPVSSDGHLVLAQHLLGLQEPQLLFDIALHLGTLAAIVVFYRRDIRELLTQLPAFVRSARPGADRRSDPRIGLWWGIFWVSVPTAVIGVLGEKAFQEWFAEPKAAAIGFLITGAALFSTRLIHAAQPSNPITAWPAFFIGIGQGAAIAPGVSRSALTLSAGLWFGLDRELAARLSFLAAVPAILGAAAFEARNLDEQNLAALGPTILGTLVAAVTGFGALWLLLDFVRRGRLYWFSIYAWGVGLAALALL